MTGAGGQCECEIYREERNRDLKAKRRENYNKREQEFKKKKAECLWERPN